MQMNQTDEEEGQVPLDEIMSTILQDFPTPPAVQPVRPLDDTEQPAVQPVHADTAQPLPSSDDTFVDYLSQVNVAFYTDPFDLLSRAIVEAELALENE